MRSAPSAHHCRSDASDRRVEDSARRSCPRTGRGPAAHSRCQAGHSRADECQSIRFRRADNPFDAGAIPIKCLEQGRLAGAVAAEQGDDLVVVQREIDVVEDVALAVEGIDIGDRQHALVPAAVSPGLAATAMRRSRYRPPALSGSSGIFDGTVNQHATFIHDRDMVGELEHPVDVMLDQQHREVCRDALDDRADALAFGGGKSRQRFVQQQDARCGGQRHAHVDEAFPP